MAAAAVVATMHAEAQATEEAVDTTIIPSAVERAAAEEVATAAGAVRGTGSRCPLGVAMVVVGEVAVGVPGVEWGEEGGEEVEDTVGTIDVSHIDQCGMSIEWTV